MTAVSCLAIGIHRMLLVTCSRRVYRHSSNQFNIGIAFFHSCHPMSGMMMSIWIA